MRALSILVLLLCTLLSFSLAAQPLAKQTRYISEADSSRMYERNWWVSGGIILTGLVGNATLLQRIKEKENTPVEDLPSLDNPGVRGFDTWSLRQDPTESRKYHNYSDRIFEYSTALPIMLLLDREIRNDWLDLVLLYFESHALGGLVYSASPLGPTFNDKFRPVAYYPSVDLEVRTDGETRNSLFSGHVSYIATTTFFTAKVYADYHPELGGLKYALYGLAAIPPALSGVYRIKALKHFPTDVIIGGAVGIASGLLIPTLHKKWLGKGRRSTLLVNPTYSSALQGVSMQLRF